MNSLNDCLFKGPSLTPLLFDVIIRFRINPVAFICDLRKAFLQIRISEQDRDSLRFLWVTNPHAEDPQLIVFRFAVVIFGLNCSPFLLNGTLRYHFLKFKNEHPDLASDIDRIIDSLYVDDFACGSIDTDTAYHLYILLKDVLEKGGFTIHKSLTNGE